MSLLPVPEARARIVEGVEPKPAETIALKDSFGRTLAAPIAATRDQPPFRASAMDGYAVRAGDVAPGAALRVVGMAAAGHAFEGSVGAGEAVRIFTGAPVPHGADAVLIQENTESADGAEVTATASVDLGANIREPALDFADGDALLPAGTLMGLGEIALAAAAGKGHVEVRGRPTVAILATGDELVAPGEAPRDDQIFASTGVAIEAWLNATGADARYLGIAGDNEAEILTAVEDSSGVDVLLTIGGVSVGDHDIVQDTLRAAGTEIGFWRIAMRPGKPLMFGHRGETRVIGLPGNPVSSITCLLLLARPLIDALLGRPFDEDIRDGVLGMDMPANSERAAFFRARMEPGDGALPRLVPLKFQDSSMLSELVQADALLIRDANAPAAQAGAPCQYMPLR